MGQAAKRTHLRVHPDRGLGALLCRGRTSCRRHAIRLWQGRMADVLLPDAMARLAESVRLAMFRYASLASIYRLQALKLAIVEKKHEGIVIEFPRRCSNGHPGDGLGNHHGDIKRPLGHAGARAS